MFDFKSAKATQLSEDGRILSLSATPYRGDATGQVYSLSGNSLIAEVPRGTKPVLNQTTKCRSILSISAFFEHTETTSPKQA